MLYNFFPAFAAVISLNLLTATYSFVINFSTSAQSSTKFSLYDSKTDPILTPIIDLQTFLKLTNQVASGGVAKVVIQDGQCYLNGIKETRRAKKIYPGDQVSFKGATLDASEEVARKGYVYKTKVKKEKPIARIDADGKKEFGGRYRSDEWRAERKKKKIEKKNGNKGESLFSRL